MAEAVDEVVAVLLRVALLSRRGCMKPSNLLPKKPWPEAPTPRGRGLLASVVWWNWSFKRPRPELTSVKSTDHRSSDGEWTS